MSTTTAGILFLALLVAALVAVHVPFGDYMYRVYNSDKHSRVERVIYRLIGADPKSEQSWGHTPAAYWPSPRSAFSSCSSSSWCRAGSAPPQRSRHTDDPGARLEHRGQLCDQHELADLLRETTVGLFVQMTLLAVQNFLSAAVGMASSSSRSSGASPAEHPATRQLLGRPGARTSLRVLLPIAFVAAMVMVLGGVVQNF